MEYIKTSIPDVWILEPRVFEDARGYFMETWREVDFNNAIGHESTLCARQSVNVFTGCAPWFALSKRCRLSSQTSTRITGNGLLT